MPQNDCQLAVALLLVGGEDHESWLENNGSRSVGGEECFVSCALVWRVISAWTLIRIKRLQSASGNLKKPQRGLALAPPIAHLAGGPVAQLVRAGRS